MMQARLERTVLGLVSARQAADWRVTKALGPIHDAHLFLSAPSIDEHLVIWCRRQGSELQGISGGHGVLQPFSFTQLDLGLFAARVSGGARNYADAALGASSEGRSPAGPSPVRIACDAATLFFGRKTARPALPKDGACTAIRAWAAGDEASGPADILLPSPLRGAFEDLLDRYTAPADDRSVSGGIHAMHASDLILDDTDAVGYFAPSRGKPSALSFCLFVSELAELVAASKTQPLSDLLDAAHAGAERHEAGTDRPDMAMLIAFGLTHHAIEFSARNGFSRASIDKQADIVSAVLDWGRVREAAS